MGCPSEVILGNAIAFGICTHDPDTGILTDADALPTYRIYEGVVTASILNGTMPLHDTVNSTGHYLQEITCSVANGFEVGKTYTAYIEAIVDGDTGGISFSFKVQKPDGVPKNIALPNFDFLMVDSTDHVTGQTGLTVTITVRQDGGAFAASDNAVVEVSNGIYEIDLSQAEMNADIITLLCSAVGADDRIITILTSS